MREAEFNFDHCLKCNYCQTVCPVQEVYPVFPGPKRLGPEWKRLHREKIEGDLSLVDYCLGCGNCEIICPNEVYVSKLVLEGKLAVNPKKKLKYKIRDYFLARPDKLGRMVRYISPVANWLLSSKIWKKGFFPLVGIPSHRKFPQYSSRRVEELVGAAKRKEAHGQGEKILMFLGCFSEYNRPSVGRAAIELLTQEGFEVKISSGGCCGLPALSNKDIKEFARKARNRLLEIEKYLETGYKVVTPCTSCSYTMKAYYPYFVDVDLRELAHRMAENVYDLGEFLIGNWESTGITRRLKPRRQNIFYHVPCHLKAQGIGRPWVDILGLIPEINMVELNEECCGMAGTYGFKEEKYNISMAVGSKVFRKVEERHPDIVISDCGMCQTQLEQGTGYKVRHPVEIFYEAYV